MSQLPALVTFWTCLILVIYAYAVYPALLFVVYSLLQIRRDCRFLAGRRDRRAPREPDPLPAVSLIIAAYNEQSSLLAKLANLGGIAYAADKLEILIVSDGSTDGTNAILEGVDDPRIRVVLLPARGGKVAALNHAVAQARHDILVFSDASTLLDPPAVSKLVRHFRDPGVGVACGSLQFRGSAESRVTEGVYWTYESMIRLMEARLGATLTASGAFYAVRRQCYAPPPPGTLIEDFVIPMQARKLGYRVVLDPEATAIDFAADGVAGEFARRVRLAVGSFRALPALLRTPMRGFTPIAFFSHKLLRWLMPFLLIGLLAANLALAHEPKYAIVLAAQLAFYSWAAIGGVFRGSLTRVRFALLAYFLLAMNAAFLVGFVHCLAGRREVKWQRAA